MRRIPVLPPLLACWLVLAPPAPAPRALAQPLPGHGGPVRALAMAADGRSLASGGFDQAVMAWATGPDAALPAGLERPLGLVRWHRGAVQALAALPGGGFASGGEDGRIALWAMPLPGDGQLSTGQPRHVLEGHAAGITALAAREGWLLSASWDGTARLWRLADGTARVLDGHQGPVTAVAFRRDGLPATAGADGTLWLWPEAGPPRRIAEYGMPQAVLLALPGGGLASAGADGVVRLLSADGLQRRLEAGSTPLTALAVAGTAEAGLLAAAGPAGGIHVWSLPEGRLRHSLSSAGVPVWSLALSPEGDRLYAGGADGRLRVFDMARGLALGAEPGPPPEHRPGPDLRGARVFRACGACHSLSAPPAGQQDLKAGPHLGGLFGRRMGSVPGYPYSARLARGDIVWTPETVGDLFTRGPDVVTPGTHMPVQILADPAEREALMRFLGAATRD